MSGRYRGYDVLDKWSSPSFDDATRAVLERRLHHPPERRFFTPAEWRLMETLCGVLAPVPDTGEPIPITPWIDAELAEGHGEGWRCPGMPPVQQAWREGLNGIGRQAQARHGRPFTELSLQEQDAECRQLFDGEADKAVWRDFPAKTFFRDMLLKAIASVCYSHPALWSDMGFGGPASPRGYVRIGLDERDPWEAREHRPGGER